MLCQRSSGDTIDAWDLVELAVAVGATVDRDAPERSEVRSSFRHPWWLQTWNAIRTTLGWEPAAAGDTITSADWNAAVAAAQN